MSRSSNATRHAADSAEAGIAEGIKWKVPGFRTHEHFATFNLRDTAGIDVVRASAARL